MPTVLLPLLPGTLPSGACYDSEQARLNAYAEITFAQLDGMAFYNFGPDAPSTDNNIYPWLRTTDNIWYIYQNGGWYSRVPKGYSEDISVFWKGTLMALQTHDGGDTNAPSAYSGPMWEVDSDMEARFPIGAGTLQPSGTVLTTGQTGGADEVTLTSAQLPETPVVPLDSNGDPIGDTTVQKTGDSFGFSFQNGDFSGSASGGRMSDVPLQLAGSGDPHSNMPPYRVGYWIKWTGRLYYQAV